MKTHIQYAQTDTQYALTDEHTKYLILFGCRFSKSWRRKFFTGSIGTFAASFFELSPNLMLTLHVYNKVILSLGMDQYSAIGTAEGAAS